MYKLMLSDLDETLLVKHHVPEFNVEAIKAARKKGLKFVPATGRAYNMIPEILKEIDAYDQEGEYSICFNGALIVENKNNRIIEFKGLEFSKMKEIFEAGLNFDVCIHVYTPDNLYVFNLSESERQRIKNQKLEAVYPEVNSVDFLKDTPISKILYQNVDVPYLMSLEEGLKPITDGHCAVSYSSNRYMEFNALGVDKGQGLIDLANKLGLSLIHI